VRDPEDVAVFGQQMQVLGETLNESLSSLRIEGYFFALADLPLDVVARGIAEVMRRQRVGFPRPAEIRSAALGDAEALAEDGWREVVAAVRRYGYAGITKKELTADGVRFTNHPPPFSDPRVLETVERISGSWPQFCTMLPLDGAAFVGVWKQFAQVYRTIVTRHQFDAPARAALAAVSGGTILRALDELAKSKALPPDDTAPGSVVSPRAEPALRVVGRVLRRGSTA
jgi:hypothetical protein